MILLDSKECVLKLMGNVIYYFLVSPLLLLGGLPIYLCLSLDTMINEGRWLGVREFKSELEHENGEW